MTADYRLIPKIPPQPEDSRFKISPLLPFKRTSPLWYLAWPQPVIGDGSPLSRSWWCYAGPRAVSEKVIVGSGAHAHVRTYVVDYCGAPPGVRCSCGTQAQGHDPGDESHDDLRQRRSVLGR